MIPRNPESRIPEPRDPGIPKPRNPGSPGFRDSASGQRKARRGFTLLELIVSVTVLVVIMGILLQLTTSVQRIWRRGSDVSETARTAQRTLDLLASDLAAAVAPQFAAAGNGSDAEEPSAATTRSPLVFALSADSDATSPLLSQGDDCTAPSFSRLLFTSQAPRPVWGTSRDDDSLPSPSRRESGTRLRSVLGIQYRVLEDSSVDDADSSTSESSETSTPLRFSLVRSVAGLEPAKGSDSWWENIDDLPGEPIARNVVLFSVTVPTFLAAETSETDTLAYEFGAYATRSDSTLALSSGTETGPLPLLVDIVLGLVPERDLLQIESLASDSDREELLRLRTRIYTRRIALFPRG